MKATKTIRVSIYFKLAFISTLVVIIFGAINIYILYNSVYKSFEKEIDKRSRVLAKIIAEKSLNPIVYENHLEIYNIFDEIMQSDPSVSYIFILDQHNEVIAQTFAVKMPETLIKANSLADNNYHISLIKTNNFKHPTIRDIAYPILNGDLGTVRLGIVEEHIQQELTQAAKTLSLMIAAFIVIGLLGTLYFAYLITSPIKKISQKAQSIDLNSIDTQSCELENGPFTKFSRLRITDEMDVLITKFSEMLMRLKKNYIELKETQSALIQAEKMASLGTLSAGVAHEINNPISGIKNCVARIQKKPDNIERNLEYIEMIGEATDKIEKVVRHLLSYSRKHDFVLNKINLKDIIQSAILLTKHRISKLNIEIIYHSPQDLWINGSANHLEQVFVNLILNSIDAITEKNEIFPELSGKIQIKTAVQDNMAMISVIDNGIGISQENQSKIFDPFFTSKEVGKGTGLGLSLSYNLIKKHHGSIDFFSIHNEGTEFRLEIPIFTEEKQIDKE